MQTIHAWTAPGGRPPPARVAYPTSRPPRPRVLRGGWLTVASAIRTGASNSRAGVREHFSGTNHGFDKVVNQMAFAGMVRCSDGYLALTVYGYDCLVASMKLS